MNRAKAHVAETISATYAQIENVHRALPMTHATLHLVVAMQPTVAIIASAILGLVGRLLIRYARRATLTV